MKVNDNFIKWAAGGESPRAGAAKMDPARTERTTDTPRRAGKGKGHSMNLRGVAASCAAVLALGAGLAALPSRATDNPEVPAAKVTRRRVPDAGIQPQAAVDGEGVVHLIYFKGEPFGGDAFYVRS